MNKTVLIDNYDSFTYNLYHYLGELGGNPVVVTNDQCSVDSIKEIKPTHIVISPGPGNPERIEDFGICMDVIKQLGGETPLLGVCLGHQGIISAFGGKIVQASEIMHGKKSMVLHNQKGLFAGIETPIEVMRYHSLVADVDSFPGDLLEVVARVEGEQTIMAVEHRSLPIYGIQFHPESIGTDSGKKILENFLKIAI